MSKLTRAATTTQTLTLAAMEEASRQGVREADLEHLLLALVINDQSAGASLRSLGITLRGAREAVEAQRTAELAILGITVEVPVPGRIVFHETAGYKWSERAMSLIGRAGEKKRTGDAGAVLRELVIEPSGRIADLLERLGTTPGDVLETLQKTDLSYKKVRMQSPPSGGIVSGTREVFVPAKLEEVWELLADPAQIPSWEPSIASMEGTDREVAVGLSWMGHAAVVAPDGKQVRVKQRFRRRCVELIEAERPSRITWCFSCPDAPRTTPSVTSFRLAETTGGTQVTITTSWFRRRGWRGIIGVPLRPLQRFLIWISLTQVASGVSRAFRD